jgi:hypothetical protein
MRVSMLFMLLLILIKTPLFAQTSEKSIEGMWYAEDISKSTILIYNDNYGSLSGKIIKSSDDGLVNKIPLTAFRFEAEKDRFIGKVKPASRNFELDGEINIIDENTLRLVGSRFFITKTFL